MDKLLYQIEKKCEELGTKAFGFRKYFVGRFIVEINLIEKSIVVYSKREDYYTVGALINSEKWLVTDKTELLNFIELVGLNSSEFSFIHMSNLDN